MKRLHVRFARASVVCLAETVPLVCSSTQPAEVLKIVGIRVYRLSHRCRTHGVTLQRTLAWLWCCVSWRWTSDLLNLLLRTQAARRFLYPSGMLCRLRSRLTLLATRVKRTCSQVWLGSVTVMSLMAVTLECQAAKSRKLARVLTSAQDYERTCVRCCVQRPGPCSLKSLKRGSERLTQSVDHAPVSLAAPITRPRLLSPEVCKQYG